MIIIPAIGPKNELKVSTNDKIPTLLRIGSQKMANRRPKKIIKIPELLIVDFVGKKLIIEFCDGI